MRGWLPTTPRWWLLLAGCCCSGSRARARVLGPRQDRSRPAGHSAATGTGRRGHRAGAGGPEPGQAAWPDRQAGDPQRCPVADRHAEPGRQLERFADSDRACGPGAGDAGRSAGTRRPPRGGVAAAPAAARRFLGRAGCCSDLVATTAVLRALIAAGVLAVKPPIRSAVNWLLGQQNSDAGWTSARHPAGSGRTGDRPRGGSAPDGGRPAGGRRDRPRSRLAGAGAAGRRWRRWRPAAGPEYARRRRMTLVPGLLLPLGALGRFVATSLPDEAAARAVHAGAVHADTVRAAAVDADAGLPPH